MIIRKPFKFLIEHFKIINVILMLLVSFVIFKFFNIMQFFGNFVTNSYTTSEVDLAAHYIGILLPIALIVIILINIIHYKLLIKSMYMLYKVKHLLSAIIIKKKNSIFEFKQINYSYILQCLLLE